MDFEFSSFYKQFSSLSGIEQADLELVLPYLEKREIKKGEHFITEGNYCKHIGFINQGLFRIYLRKNGEELNTCFCFENSIISSFDSFVNDIPTHENIQALEDSILITLSIANVKKLSEESNAWAKLRSKLTEQECLRLSNRANEMSFETALGKYQNLIENEPQIIQRVSNYHIASYLGITKETLSRIRAKIKL
ncbi:MAG: Crp/Fnr family transcriptional regulator [Flavobacteriales bacterium]